MTTAVIEKLEKPLRGRPRTYATSELKSAAFKARKEKAGLVLAWMPKELVAAYRAGRDGSAK